jgi:hypothetical protein
MNIDEMERALQELYEHAKGVEGSLELVKWRLNDLIKRIEFWKDVLEKAREG